jgi:hypothetical protein
MIKLYKRVNGKLHYHEAWENERIIYEHWGVVGECGDSREHALAKRSNGHEAIQTVLQPAIANGYEPIEFEDHITLLIEYAVEGMGAPEDVDKRHALENRMNETLGWTGLGMCDGGSIGSGTMEVCCFVVDFDVAKRVIENDLQGTPFSDFLRIYDENA